MNIPPKYEDVVAQLEAERELHKLATETLGQFADENQKLHADLAALRELSVENIMLDVIPGKGGVGEEIYAKSIADVEALLTKQCDSIEELQGREEELREELLELSRKLDVFYSRSHGIKNLSAIEYANDKAQGLQQRLTVAEKLLRETLPHLRFCKGMGQKFAEKLDGLDLRIEAALKPAEEGEGS